MEKGRGREGEPLGRGGASVVEERLARSGRTKVQGDELAVLLGEGMKVGVRGAESIWVKRGESSRRRDAALVARAVSEGETGETRRERTRACRSNRAGVLR